MAKHDVKKHTDAQLINRFDGILERYRESHAVTPNDIIRCLHHVVGRIHNEVCLNAFQKMHLGKRVSFFEDGSVEIVNIDLLQDGEE